MKTILTWIAICFCGFSVKAQSVYKLPGSDKQIISLAGIWNFKLDPFSIGVGSNGVQLFPNLAEEIVLPGSTDQAGKGYKTQEMTSLRLTRMFEYKGAAWYEKEVFIPEDWGGKEIELFLERAHWESQIWINNKYAGRQESLSTPHIYHIAPFLKPGVKNVIRIRVDNNRIYDIEYSHAISAETQTNWNGVIGRMELRAFDKVSIEDIQVYPQIKREMAEVKVRIANRSGNEIEGVIKLEGEVYNTTRNHDIPLLNAKFSGKDSLIDLTVELPLEDAVLWDEFNPALYRLQIEVKANANGQDFYDSKQVSFGMREVGVEGTRLTINDRVSFIRATVNCGEFPITGYPPTDLDSWMRILKICKDYGLNAMRFHSWCPPEAAFTAADLLGLYLQVENSDWRFTVGKDSATNRFLREDADRILKTYGNHPSFIFFGEGNELVGPTVKNFLSELVADWKRQDPRRVYTGSSAYPLVPENDFNVLYGARPQRWKEGLKGRFNVQPLNTLYDYSEYVKKHDQPMITHEVGQWCVFPDFSQISKYTGVLKPFNYELFREALREKGMLNQAEQFTMASGRFQVIQKKEEIESYLRTPGMAGYHLLQLNDFPGQGTSPVGIVDVFWEPKPYVTAEEFRTYQSDRTFLLRTPSFTWTSDQNFEGELQFANFGSCDLNNIKIAWTLSYPDETIFEEGDIQASIPVGSPIPIDKLSISLAGIKQATRLRLSVQAGEIDCSNSWDIWVYPEKIMHPVRQKDVLVTSSWDAKTKRHLQKGGKVLLLADTAKVDSDIPASFSGISWNAVWSGMPPNLLGILCDPDHPALKAFPTEFHSNWQWWDLVAKSKPFQLDHTPGPFIPLVQMIPDWNNPKKIGLVFEGRIGEGKLIVSAIDLINGMEERPVARQMLHSLLQYVNSDEFAPTHDLNPEWIDVLFK